MENKCSVKASVPMLHWSQNKELLRWAILTKCGKDKYVDLVRGSKHPTEVLCCGSEPKDPNKTDSMILRTNSIIVTGFQNLEESNSMNESNESVSSVETEKPLETSVKSTKTVEWPNKEELSNLVNSQSMRSLSKKLNTSVNNIKKHCKELEIEIPAMRFNWSKT